MSRRWQSTAFNQLLNTELYAILRLRQQVFAIEQDSLYLDLDNLDQGARHMLCWEGEQLIAYQRILAPGVSYPESSLGRIVVHPGARGQNLGREIVQRGIDHNLSAWPDYDIRINAQAYLRQFYRELGFIEDSDVYDEDGIPHIEMLYRRPH